MGDGMYDGPDPQFPDRPNTETFRKIAAQLRVQDQATDVHEFLNADELEALSYIAEQRQLMARRLLPEISDDRLMMLFYIDAFTAGMRYKADE